jgi:TetR/AcrR family tetracycline transcriptional repressor
MAKRGEAAVRERLSRETIITSALALADSEGLDAVTIRRLAQDHGVTPMALYWHFKEKEQLLDGLAERLFADVVLPVPTPRATWHQQLREVLDAILAAVRPHPSVAHLALNRVLTSTAGLVIAERVLGLLRGARFSPEQAADVGGYLLCSIITLVTSEPGAGAVADDDERDAMTRQRRAALLTLSPKEYPNVIASADALASCANEEAYYRRGIDMLVQGTRGVQPKS